MDGTLLDENGQVPPETYELILALREHGVHFAASSGRRYDRLCEFFAPVRDKMDFVAANGAQVFADGKMVDREVYSHLAIRRLAQAVATFPNLHLALFDRTKSFLLDDECKFVREVDKDLPNAERIWELPDPSVNIIKASIFCDDGAIRVAKQLWYDFGLGKGGDIFTLAGEFLQSDDFMKQAKFIAEAANMTVAGWEKPVYLSKPTESVFEDVEVAPLLRSLLTEYLEERGIPYAIASRHCCRLNYGVRGKRYFAVGFPNMAGGYEVRSRYFKGCIPPKSVSLVKANDIPADECLVFEGFMDFLSAVTLGVTGNADCLVLNSVANVEKAAGLLDGYGRIGCFLDRDEAGRRTLAALTMRYGERVTDRSSLYDGCKDLNEYLQLTTKKQKNNHLKIEEQ